MWTLAFVQIIVLAIVVKCWSEVWPPGGIGDTVVAPDTDLHGTVPDGRATSGCGSGTRAADSWRGRPRSFDDRSVVLWRRPTYLLVWQDQLIVAGVYWAFLVTSVRWLKKVCLVQGKECVRRGVRLEGLDTVDIPPTIGRKANRLQCTRRCHGLQAGPEGWDHGLGLYDERSDRKMSQFIIDLGKINGMRLLRDLKWLHWAHFA
jgi:hypothetical protein